MTLPFAFQPYTLMAHSGCGTPASQAYENESSSKVELGGLVAVSHVKDIGRSTVLHLRVWNGDVAAAAEGHGPLVAGGGRNEAVELVDLECEVAQAVVVRWNGVHHTLCEWQVIESSDF